MQVVFKSFDGKKFLSKQRAREYDRQNVVDFLDSGVTLREFMYALKSKGLLDPNQMTRLIKDYLLASAKFDAGEPVLSRAS